jgi:hypothetical protein
VSSHPPHFEIPNSNSENRVPNPTDLRKQLAAHPDSARVKGVIGDLEAARVAIDELQKESQSS